MYESHITVDGLNDVEFKSICRRIGVKPVIIEEDTGSNKRQIMTSRFHKTNDKLQAMREMEAIASNFQNVIRRKLEKIIGKKDDLPEHLYLEFHLKYEVPKSEVEQFVAAVNRVGGHTSRNIVNGFVFATARSVEVYSRLKSELCSYRRVNGIMECVVFDDNPSIDVGWCGCEGCGFKEIPNEI